MGLNFYLSKIFWYIANPFNVIFLLLISGWLFLFIKPRIGKILISSVLALIFLLGLNPFSSLLLYTLENRISPGIIPDQIDGIIVLAGAVDMKVSRYGLIELTGESDRIIEGIILAKKYPEASLIITGGSGSLDQSETLREADYLQKLAVLLGIAKDRILIERNSRNTHEHAVELSKLLPKKDSGKWVLITSAFHMPRSYGCFKREGIKVIPYPVDFKTDNNIYTKLLALPKTQNIGNFSVAFHEWIGLIAYWIAEYTNTIFPVD